MTNGLFILPELVAAVTGGDVIWTIFEVAMTGAEVALCCGEVAMTGREVALNGCDVPLTGVEAVLPDEKVTLNCEVMITYESYLCLLYF